MSGVGRVKCVADSCAPPRPEKEKGAACSRGYPLQIFRPTRPALQEPGAVAVTPSMLSWSPVTVAPRTLMFVP